MDPFLGEIRIFAGNFAPQGWALCQGQLLSISQNAALFAILGTTYGGNGVSTFGLPNLAGRCVLGLGTSTTGAAYIEGQFAGTENVTLGLNNLPSHTHTFAQPVSSAVADQTDPTGAIPAVANDATSGDNVAAYTKTHTTGNMPAGTTGTAGQGLPMTIMQPYMVINYIIAMVGIFPSRG